MGRFIPRSNEPGGRRRAALGRVALTCCLLLAAPVVVSAQSADNVRTAYLREPIFNIPFTPRPNDSNIALYLYVSRDRQPYRFVASAWSWARDHRFLFDARKVVAPGQPIDGWYVFVVQTNSNGVWSPPNVQDAPPELRVCIDTQPPKITEFKNLAAPGSYPVLTWNVEDANFDDVRAEYRVPGSTNWVPLPLPRRQRGEYPWQPSADLGSDFEVRLQARDRADNQSQSQPISVRIEASAAVSAMPPRTEASGFIPILHVQKPTFDLSYDVDNQGPSGVQRIDVWKMRPGSPWQKCKEQGEGNQKKVTVSVPYPGRWGFRLIPRNGVGLAEPDPRTGDPPDVWVEVDDKAPQVSVTNVSVSPPAEGGYLTVYWKASDTYLRAAPINLWYAATPQAQWKPLASNLPNNGSWSEPIERLRKRIYDETKVELPFEFHLKVTAVDEAGNRGEATWRDIVKIDLQIPRIKIIKPDSASPSETPVGGDYRPQSSLRTPQTPSGTLPSMDGVPGFPPSSSSVPASTRNGNRGFNDLQQSAPHPP
jgi:hypothetical protein